MKTSIQFNLKALLISAFLSCTLLVSEAQNTVPGRKTVLIATIHILPEFEKEVKGALKIMERTSRKEPGCEQFVAYIQKDSAQTVVICEVYKNDEAFHFHITSSHAKSFFEFVKGKIVNDKIETVFLTELNNSQQIVKHNEQ